MSSFTERTVQRALGETGRIQPRIAPITAPDPWSPPDADSLDLEPIEEVETAPAIPTATDHPARPTTRRPVAPRSATDDPARPTTPRPVAPWSTTERLAVPQPNRESPPELPLSAPAAPQTAAESFTRSQLAASTVPSFRAREPELVARMRTPAPRLPPPERSETSELFAEQVAVTSGAARGSAAAPILESDPGATVHAFDGSSTPRDASPSQPRATGARSRAAASASRRPQGSPELRTGAAEVDPAPWDSPSLEVAAARRTRRGAENSDPIVRVHIGKVEVRAAASPAPAVPRAARPDAFVTLQQYLHKRGES